MAISNEQIMKKIEAMESLINSKAYEYAICFDPERCLLRRDKKTNVIEVIEGAEDFIPNKNTFIILFPKY